MKLIKQILGEAYDRAVLIVIIVLLVLLGWQTFRNQATKKALEVCRELPQDTIREVSIRTISDTIYRQIIDTIRVKIVEHPEADSAGVRVYRDTVRTEIGNLYSTAFVEGYMRRREVHFGFNIPEVTNTTLRTESVTIWKEKRYNKFYAVGTIDGIKSDEIDFKVGLTFIPANDKLYFNYNYSPFFKSHSVGIGFRVFRF